MMSALLGCPQYMWAQELQEQEVNFQETQKSSDQGDIEAAWQPKRYQFSRYQKMLAKDPFGKVPVDAPPPAVVEELPPVEEKQLAIAAVSVVEGKPVVYLIDLKTRAYQKINTEEENESNIRLVEISESGNPRDVVAKVMINGIVSTVKYDMGILDAKPKSMANRKSRTVKVASNRSVQPTRIQPVNPAIHATPAQNANRPQANTRSGQGGPDGSGAARVPQAFNGVPSAARGQVPVPVVRSIQDQRRLSAVPRRRVIVPGNPLPQSTEPTQELSTQP